MNASGGFLSVVVPMWNEEDNVETVVEAVAAVGERLMGAGELEKYELVVVNDASTDTTAALADQLAERHPWIQVVHHPENRGLGGAVRSGLLAARGDLVLYTDADAPCDMAEVIEALRLMRTYRADIVSAWRKDRTAEGPRRMVYSFAYNRVVRAMFGLQLRDVNFAFKLIRRNVLEAVALESEGSFIDAELLIRAHRLGFKIVQFGVDFFPRTRGVSTLSSPQTIVKIVKEMRELRDGLGVRPVPGRRDARLLVINADDYGLTEAVSRGILRAHEHGIVTSTSVLVLAPAFERTAPWLADHPNLGVGVHLAAVGEDPPLLSAREIPTLVDRDGKLPLTWKQFVLRALGGRVSPDDLQREFGAQMERARSLGIVPTHVDTHQHLHLWPVVRDVVVDVAQRNGVLALRTPRSASYGPVGLGVNLLGRRLSAKAAAAGLTSTKASAGLDEAGTLHHVSLREAIDRLARTGAPTMELFVHPGEHDDPDRGRYRWGYKWGEELDALTDPSLRAELAGRGIRLGSYAELTA